MNKNNLVKLLIEMFGTTSPANTQSNGDKVIVFRPDAGVDSYVNITTLTSFAAQLSAITNAMAFILDSSLYVTGISTFENTATGSKFVAETASDDDSDTSDVLVTTIANTEYGMLMVRESVGTEACMYMIAGGNIEKVSSDATFTVTKDNASTYNVYFEDTVIKVQNKVGDDKNINVGLFAI